MGSRSIVHLSPREYSPKQRGVPGPEAALHEAASTSAKLFAPPDWGKLVVIPELDIGGFRPDLWIGSFDERVFKRRLDAGLGACTAPYPLAIVRALRRLGGEASINQLTSRALHLGERRRIQRGVSELVDRGLAERDNGSVLLHSRFVLADARGVGVEAKVGRWRKAVRQVQMWRTALNGAWLLFPESYLGQVPRQRPGTRSIGLAVADESGTVSIVRRPRLTSGPSLGRLLTEEHLYARWVDESKRKPTQRRGNAVRRRPAAARASAGA
jgi:hypothetical protein